MALSNQTREAIIPPPPPPSIDAKEELRQVGFLLKQKGHYLVFRASRSMLVDGWSNNQNSAEYSEAFGHMLQGTHFRLYKIAFNKMKPQRTDIYVVHTGHEMPKLLQKWFEPRSQEFLYNGTDAAEALAVATNIIKQISESIK